MYKFGGNQRETSSIECNKKKILLQWLKRTRECLLPESIWLIIILHSWPPKYNVWYTWVQNWCKSMRRRCIIKHYAKYLQTKEGNHSLVEGFFWLMNTLTAYVVIVVRAADIFRVLCTSWLHRIPTNNRRKTTPLWNNSYNPFISKV